MPRPAFVTALALFLIVAVSTPVVAQRTDLAAERSSLDTLCRAGDALQCYYLGESYLQGGDQADPGKAAIAYTRSCALLSGFRIACEKAELFANTAAEQVKCDSGDGNAQACFDHANGRSSIAQLLGTTDTLELVYMEKACRLNLLNGCYRAADRLIKRNDPRGRVLFAKGCELGDGASCYRLAAAYADGRGGPVNVAVARQFYTRSCAMTQAVRLGCDEAVPLSAEAKLALETRRAEEQERKAAAAQAVTEFTNCTALARAANVRTDSVNTASAELGRKYDEAMARWKGDAATRRGIVSLVIALNSLQDGACVALEKTVYDMIMQNCPAAQIGEFRAAALGAYNLRNTSRFGGTKNCRIGLRR